MTVWAQVVYGMVRYKKMLKVLLTALYFKHGSEVSRDDYGMYMVYAYLAVIRLDDLGASVFTKFILAQVWGLFFAVGSNPNIWRTATANSFGVLGGSSLIISEILSLNSSSTIARSLNCRQSVLFV